MSNIWVEVIFISLIFISGCVLGFAGAKVSSEITEQRALDGLYFPFAENITSVMNYANKKDSWGDWVCVNVAYDMSPNRAYDVCVHECAHKAYSEIFAERCEADIEGCSEAIVNFTETFKKK